MHRAACDTGEPAPAVVVGWGCFECRQGAAWREAQSLDDLAAIGAPKPDTPGDERVGHGKRERPARERKAILDQMRTEFRQQPIGARHPAGCIDEPGERRGKLHAAIMRSLHRPCH